MSEFKVPIAAYLSASQIIEHGTALMGILATILKNQTPKRMLVCCAKNRLAMHARLPVRTRNAPPRKSWRES